MLNSRHELGKLGSWSSPKHPEERARHQQRAIRSYQLSGRDRQFVSLRQSGGLRPRQQC